MPAKSLKRRRRITDSALFAEVLKRGSRASAGSLQAKYSTSAGTGQLGLGIAKRHLKRAVDRNLVKRIVREAYRLGPAHLNTINMVVLLNRAPASLRSAAGRRSLAHEAARLMAKSGGETTGA